MVGNMSRNEISKESELQGVHYHLRILLCKVFCLFYFVLDLLRQNFVVLAFSGLELTL